jgi:hypothetical protein
MATYVIVNRAPASYTPSPEAAAAWNAWFQRLGDSLVDRGNPVFKRTTLGNVDAGTALGGYTLVSAASLEEAAGLARDCPALGYGGGVEIGELMMLNAGMRPVE